MKVTVIGCGRWGTCIAWHLCRIGHDVTLYGLPGAADVKELIETRKNALMAIPDELKVTTDLDCVKNAEVIVISVGSQSLRTVMKNLLPYELKGVDFVLCMKGIECSSGMRLTEVVNEYKDESCRVAVWIGPGHVQEFYRGIPNCMVIDSESEELKQKLVGEFNSDLIRFYYGCDLIGNEIGAATKNVIGIAAGMLDGLGLSTLKGALMSRGTREIARLIKAMGGNELSAYGLCHLGDYEATVFSEFSHNRMFGELFVKGEKYGSLAEGYYTVDALMVLKTQYAVDLPICEAVWQCLYNGADVRDELTGLFTRALKDEI